MSSAGCSVLTNEQHLRIVRTLAPGDEALSTTMSVENIWPEKCNYSISTPHKACVFGTLIPLDISISSLLKGLSVGAVTCQLRELTTFQTKFPAPLNKKQGSRVVQSIIFDETMFEEAEDGSERWIMHAKIPLPRSLAKCVQDCEVGKIKVRHKLRISVQLNNPDGHTSELRASLPVLLFISPNHLMGEDNEIHSNVPAETIMEDITAIPPRYDEHVYDRLWDEIQQENYNTPLPSGANTPAFLSRNNSVENLPSTGATTPNTRFPSGLSPPEPGFMHRVRRRSNSRERPSTSSSSHASNASTSGGSSAEDITATTLGGTPTNSRPQTSAGPSSGLAPNPALSALSAGDLSRVPSYRTALRTGPRSLVTSTIDLPSYDDNDRGSPSGSASAVSAPRSPPPTLLPPPALPHASTMPSSSSSSSSPRTRGARVLSFALRTGHGVATAHAHSSSAQQQQRVDGYNCGFALDADRRLRLLQARGR